MRWRLACAVGVAFALGGAASAASPPRHEAKASLGSWGASLTYTVTGTQYARRVGAMRLRVRHSGKVVAERALPMPKDCREYPCSNLGPGFFEIVDLDVASGPVGIVWLWTGGAHCCSVVQLVPLGGGGAVGRNFGDPGAVPMTLDGKRVLRSADDRFAYLFTSYAASGLPVQIWQFTGTKLVDVTREHRDEVRADATGWWQLYRAQSRSKEGETRGAFAAWAADVCLLGQRRKVETELAAGLARGDFSGPAASDLLEPHGKRYAQQLRARLGAWGYCR